MQDLNGRRIRVDYSVTDRPHAPTPGEYMGHRRTIGREPDRRERGGPYRDSYRDRDYRRDYDDRDRYYDRDRIERYDRYAERDRERDPYGRDRDWRRRSPPPLMRRGYSPERRRRSYSRSPPRGSSPMGIPRAREYDLPPPPPPGSALNGDPRW